MAEGGGPGVGDAFQVRQPQSPHHFQLPHLLHNPDHVAQVPHVPLADVNAVDQHGALLRRAAAGRGAVTRSRHCDEPPSSCLLTCGS